MRGIPLTPLVPKLKLGNSVSEAPASRFAKLELRLWGSQSGDWELAFVAERDAGASRTAFPRRSVGTLQNFVSFVLSW